MPVELASAQALSEVLALSSGELWIALLTIQHDDLAAPLRFATPVRQSVTSQGRIFAPTRFDVVVSSASFDAPAKVQVNIEAVDGTFLAVMQVLDPSPLIDIEVVTESEPDLIQEAQRELEIARFSVNGIQSITLELSSESVLTAPFPGKRMTRAAVPGIFTDL